MLTETETALAVLDLGKTNAKLIVFGAQGEILHAERSTPHWRNDGGVGALDHAGLWAWIEAACCRAAAAIPLSGVMVTTHGCACALIGKDGLCAPILDYEWAIPAAVSAEFDAIAPPFAETLSPSLPAGMNFGRQIFWHERNDPGLMPRVEAILCFPQYWNWRLSGARVSEVSYIGCHSHLWAPRARDFSSLVDRRGWRAKFPPPARAGAVLGEWRLPLADGRTVELAVHNGVHDSNAALYFYRSLGYRSFTLVSTGTWVIAFNTDCPLEALDPARDMLANVSVDGDPVATARFMGGREFDVISAEARSAVPAAAVAAAIAAGQFALPSFAPGSGPFPGGRGRFVGPEPAEPMQRAAVATLYIACMTATVLRLLRSANTIVIDGGLAKNPVYLGLVAALAPGQRVLQNQNAEGTASGAAALAFEALGQRRFQDPCVSVRPLDLPGLDAYFRAWQERAAPASQIR